MSQFSIQRAGGHCLLLALVLASCGQPLATDGDAGQVAQRADAGHDPGPDGGPGDGGSAAGPSECDDGIDNDGDGLVDWQYDLGCYGPGDRTEASRPRDEEDGFTTFDVGPDSRVIYVSADGDDALDGSSPEDAVRTLSRGAELVRDGHHDFLLLRRGDTWRDEELGRFKSGRDAEHPLVVASYGESMERPRLEVDGFFINHGGAERSFVAVIGLHIVPFRNDPADPMHTGAANGAFRYVGGGSGLLIEGCHLEYCEIVLQSYDEHHYDGVEIRRNVIERAYHADTCLPGNPNGNAAHRPSGMYISHADHVTIEENILDHNGWNPDEAPSACATMYNHNLYVNGHDMVIRGNVLARASSIHIKMRSDSTGDMRNFVIDNNLMVEGEIGVSVGGNTNEPHRFADGVVRNNVLTDIGRTRPTTRNLAWGIDVRDNDGTVIEHNYFLNQHAPGPTNTYALQLGDSGTNRDLTVQNNIFYRIQRRALLARPTDGYGAVRILGNTFADPDQNSCLVEHDGALDTFDYRDNRYYTSADADAWFCLDDSNVSFADWTTRTGETGATELGSLDFTDPNRDVESYAATLGLEGSLEAFLQEARGQSRLRWRRELTAAAVNDYIRAGFE